MCDIHFCMTRALRRIKPYSNKAWRRTKSANVWNQYRDMDLYQNSDEYNANGLYRYAICAFRRSIEKLSDNTYYSLCYAFNDMYDLIECIRRNERDDVFTLSACNVIEYFVKDVLTVLKLAIQNWVMTT